VSDIRLGGRCWEVTEKEAEGDPLVGLIAGIAATFAVSPDNAVCSSSALCTPISLPEYHIQCSSVINTMEVRTQEMENSNNGSGGIRKEATEKTRQLWWGKWGSCHKRQKPQAPIRNRQTRKVANAKGLNRNTNLT